MRKHPEIYNVEEAEGSAWTRRQYRMVKRRHHVVFPGALAHIETSGKGTEQERPARNLLRRGGARRGRTEAKHYQRLSGVACLCVTVRRQGLAHSSVEACGVRVSVRMRGAKGQAGQGSCWRER